MEETFTNISTELKNVRDVSKVTKPKSLSNCEMMDNFGVSSKHYKWAIALLQEIYHKQKEIDSVSLRKITNEWKDAYSSIYGERPSLNLFFNHIYLAIVIDTILSLKFSQECRVTSGIINSDIFDTTTQDGKFITTLIAWLQDDNVIENSLIIFQKTAKTLSKYDLTVVNEDVFKGLYEELIEQSQRHKLGEYYTPKWLVELILEEVLSAWNKNKPPKILDPACGSGTFLIHSALYLKKQYNLSSKEIISHIAGFDINPLAVTVAKANIALLLNEPNLQSFHIYNKDALKDYDLFDFQTLDKQDIVVGNPPWIVLRSIKNRNYQSFVKREMLEYKLINNGDVHLNTQLDISTLFFNKCVDKYLQKNGIIGFVMPRSVIGSAHQHENFRKFECPPIKLRKIIDFEDISPLFNMPACVLIALKGSKNIYPVQIEKYRGMLLNKDVSLQDAKLTLSIIHDRYVPILNGKNKSYYYERFKVGVSIFPRSLYFVDIEQIGERSVRVRTSKEIYKIVKDPWKHRVNGETEKDFIFCTLLPWKMVPFGYIEMHPVVLPILIQNSKYKLIDINNMKHLGYIGLYSWFKEAQKIWDEHKTDKAKERFPRLLDRFNYNNLIEHQHPNNRYVVLYNATGKDITSCVVDKKNLAKFTVKGGVLSSKGFIADVKTWVFETNSLREAYYLSTILNSNVLSKIIKPYQPRGLYGARAIHRRPLEFSIPKFDEKSETHIKIALTGIECHKKVQELIKHDISKRQIRSAIKNEIREIDEIISNLLQITEVK